MKYKKYLKNETLYKLRTLLSDIRNLTYIDERIYILNLYENRILRINEYKWLLRKIGAVVF